MYSSMALSTNAQWMYLSMENEYENILTLIILPCLFNQFCSFSIQVCKEFFNSHCWCSNPVLLQCSNLQKTNTGLVESIDVVPIFLNEKELGNQKRVVNQSKMGTHVISPGNTGRTTHVQIALAKVTELFPTNGLRYSMIYAKLFKKICKEHSSMVWNTWFTNSKSQSCRLCPNLPLAISSLEIISPVCFSQAKVMSNASTGPTSVLGHFCNGEVYWKLLCSKLTH